MELRDANEAMDCYQAALKVSPDHAEAHNGLANALKEMGKLTEAEASYVELKLALSAAVRELRRRRHLTQVQLAELMRSSQSRVAKVEAGDATVSLDLLVRSLLTLGASNDDLADVISASAQG